MKLEVVVFDNVFDDVFVVLLLGLKVILMFKIFKFLPSPEIYIVIYSIDPLVSRYFVRYLTPLGKNSANTSLIVALASSGYIPLAILST